MDFELPGAFLAVAALEGDSRVLLVLLYSLNKPQGLKQQLL